MKTTFAIVSLLFFTLSTHAQPLTAPTQDSKSFDKTDKFADIQKELQSLAKKYGVNIQDVGIYATLGDGPDAKKLLDVNGNKVMIPASITKIATASAVLAHFPPGYKFKTQLLGDTDPKNGVLKGNLYLKGGGDPSFVSENLWYLVNSFTRNKIKKIEGDIVVDDSLFDKIRFDLSRQKERVDRAYDAPVGAMSFNWNSVNIFVRPTDSGTAEVFIDPQNEYIRLVNKAKTVGGNANNLLADREDEKNGDVILVGGSIGKGAKEIVVFKNITQPDLWSGYNLKSFLQQRGIEFTGTIKNGVTPEKADVLAESESKAVEHVVADMNKFSNNFVAEMLTKNLGAVKKTKGATLADGMQIINEHMQSLGIPSEQYQLQSPSGLSRENKMSSYAMWKVLQHLRLDLRVQPEFLTSLPIAGVDGTLKKRMKNSPAERWVRAKTGYLNNVVSLAGYAGLGDGRVVTFSFVYNGSTDETKIRAFFDNLLIYLVK
ncbi:D-alanyl-D-alanine carboxypeptidase/D-alanyl-D-alanine endopeptidase [Bdellovibrio reynosensis]|uniref:D-alanyl-D-alanine carboxypeptidase/D-alanyl-D-alanine-endopeptidase n=1 Tax=Bdellovibrio reynosensis TaxID=2835041 RepID=A0ABY4C7P7_9BACT|nr:D-alanyl-D-alanine carboxypeptidase/D-alanyl-D-alanine-endopeptidase [Bdellovibrio reynosensis]UOF01011.1 D-alanyl-D-alanine carboxypeptidase/D-alanyl-D-alanine-endopeptidase [Bdellovibrio reynosensis]